MNLTFAPLIETKSLFAGYGQLTVLRDITISVAEGTITVLIGGNGAGKTTLMRTLAGLLPARSGSIYFSGTPITKAPAHERVELGVALVPEGRMVFSSLSVEQNVRLGGIAHRARRGAEERLKSVYQRFPRLLERRDQLAGSLSGGEQQMLAIGRGLMAKPRLLLLDEPTLGLAPIMVKQVFAAIREMCSDGYTILLTEQNARHALEIADFGYVMENGSVRLSGTGGELSQSPEVRRAYLGL